MIPESGITRRRQSKNVHRLPFFLSRPIPRYFSFCPVSHLGACSQATNLVVMHAFLINIRHVKGSLSTSVLCGRVLLFSSGKLDFPTAAEKKTLYPCRERVATQGFRTEDFSIPSVTASDASSMISKPVNLLSIQDEGMSKVMIEIKTTKWHFYMLILFSKISLHNTTAID